MPRRHPRAFARLESMRVLNRASALALLAALALLTAAVVPAEPPDVPAPAPASPLALQAPRSEEHTSELQSPYDLVCRLLLEKKKFLTLMSHTVLYSSFS